MQWVPAIVTGVGVVALILTVVLGWIFVPNIIDDQIIDVSLLHEAFMIDSSISFIYL
jgi:hypothetical protein